MRPVAARMGRDVRSASALEIARALIRFPSVTPADGGALAYVRDLLGRGRFRRRTCRLRSAGNARRRQSLCALRERPPNLAFAGHTDVVPPGDLARWRFDPFSGEVADGQLWGRGAADMKGGVAASLAAALRFVAQAARSRARSASSLTGDEEGPAVNGTVKLVEWALAKGERFDHCMLGEPTRVEARSATRSSTAGAAR